MVILKQSVGNMCKYSDFRAYSFTVKFF